LSRRASFLDHSGFVQMLLLPTSVLTVVLLGCRICVLLSLNDLIKNDHASCVNQLFSSSSLMSIP
jgi:hypothetical protein